MATLWKKNAQAGMIALVAVGLGLVFYAVESKSEGATMIIFRALFLNTVVYHALAVVIGLKLVFGLSISSSAAILFSMLLLMFYRFGVSYLAPPDLFVYSPLLLGPH